MKIGFYGFGHMATALVTGLLKVGGLCPEECTVLAKSEQTKKKARDMGFAVAESKEELFLQSELIVLALKPSVFRALSTELKALDTKENRVVSLMASVGLDELKGVFSCPVWRIMPTVASSTGRDIVGATAPAGFEDLLSRLERLGQVQILEEDGLDALTVAASCGPGFAAKMLYSYQRACQELGFSKEQAVAITSAVFSFASSMEGEDPFVTLEEQVATKGGVTEAGNDAMGQDIKNALDRAFDTALKKTRPQK